MAGCATPQRASIDSSAAVSIWRGRLAVRIEADAQHPSAQSFSAGFELTGRPQAGELTLYTPLGGTAAALSWSEHGAHLRTNGERQPFASLDALITQAVGTDIPVAALFAWLAGDNTTAAGWSADLTNHAAGRIVARRALPLPAAELRLILEK